MYIIASRHRPPTRGQEASSGCMRFDKTKGGIKLIIKMLKLEIIKRINPKYLMITLQ